MKLSQKNTITLFRVFFVVLIIGTFGLLWNQGEKTKVAVKTTGGTLHEGIVGAPRFINPVLAQSQADHDLTRILFTPLLVIDESGIPDYKLAENITISDDRKEYTLTLKKGLVFSDGTALTSQDVLYTIETIQDPLIKSPQAASWEGVTAEIVDQYTLTFTLARAFNDFLHNFEIGVLPQHIWTDINPQEFIFAIHNSEPIGIGPYVLENIKKEENGIPSEYTLVRSQDYFESGYIDTIKFTFFENEELLIEALQNNRIDSAYGISPQSIEFLPAQTKVITESLPRYFALFLNQEKQDLFKSKSIRNAINQAINRELLTETVFDGYAKELFGPQVNNSPEKRISNQEAQAIIESEGWKKNSEGIYTKIIDNTITELAFTLTTSNIAEIQAIAENIQDQLSKIGIAVSIRSYDQGNLNQNIIRPRDYESLLFGYEVEKPSDLYAFWHSSQTNDPGLNISIFRNPQADELLESMRSENNSDLISDFNTILDREIPAIFLYQPAYIYALPSKISIPELSLQSSEDRFNNINTWYTATRKVWPFLVKK